MVTGGGADRGSEKVNIRLRFRLLWRAGGAAEGLERSAARRIGTTMAANPKMNILVVDDFATMRRIISNVLLQLGYENITEAEDGARALEIITGEPVDFVITDWNMPQMSGLDLLKAIRGHENQAKQKIPVLMVTAESLQENIVAAAQAGVNNYIIKPFDAKTLADKIAKIFG